MKLQRPLITIILIVLLGVNLIFFSLTSIGKAMSKDEMIQNIVEKYDIKETILNEENVKEAIKEFKYSSSLFDYINNEQENKIKDDIILNIENNNDVLLDEEKLTSLLKRSVFSYEIKNSVDIMGAVNDDIEFYSYKVSQYFNNDFLNTINFFKFFSNSFFSTLSFLLLIILIICVIIFERRIGLLISGIIAFFYSFFIYFLDNNFFKYDFISNVYFKDLFFLKLSLDNIYIVCFILSFVLLLVYIVKYIKKVLRDMRINSYISSWR